MQISIITINYNHLEGLKKTMSSVLEQTWQGFEYIIIDGGSTDGSANYIESHSNQLAYWVSEPDKGIYHAMNKGIFKAKGEYLLFLNSGDHFFEQTVLDEVHSQIKEYDLIYCDWQLVDNNSSKIFRYPDELHFSHMFFNSLPHQSTFIKKALFDQVGLYDEDLKIVSDWKFMIIALFIYDCTYKHINSTLTTFYLDGISNKVDFIPEREQVLKQYFAPYVEDYKLILDIKRQKKILGSNRYKMLAEIEKTWMGKKIVSLFFRLYIILFSKKKLSDVLNQK
ncbi:MAG TPA: glycosyltransferase family 2 protein [Mangrovimonas sp.]|nr:glycosyltransferase family 2 protein [Mangrovimonas sp.]